MQSWRVLLVVWGALLFAGDAQPNISAMEWISTLLIPVALGSRVSVSYSALALVAAFTIHCYLGLHWHIRAQRYLALWSLWALAEVLCASVELSLKALLRSCRRSGDAAGPTSSAFAALAGEAAASCAELAPGAVGCATLFLGVGDEEEVQAEAARDAGLPGGPRGDADLDRQRDTRQAPASPDKASLKVVAEADGVPVVVRPAPAVPLGSHRAVPCAGWLARAALAGEAAASCAELEPGARRPSATGEEEEVEGRRRTSAQFFYIGEEGQFFYIGEQEEEDEEEEKESREETEEAVWTEAVHDADLSGDRTDGTDLDKPWGKGRALAAPDEASWRVDAKADNVPAAMCPTPAVPPSWRVDAKADNVPAAVCPTPAVPPGSQPCVPCGGWLGTAVCDKRSAAQGARGPAREGDGAARRPRGRGRLAARAWAGS